MNQSRFLVFLFILIGASHIETKNVIAGCDLVVFKQTVADFHPSEPMRANLKKLIDSAPFKWVEFAEPHNSTYYERGLSGGTESARKNPSPYQGADEALKTFGDLHGDYMMHILNTPRMEDSRDFSNYTATFALPIIIRGKISDSYIAESTWGKDEIRKIPATVISSQSISGAMIVINSSSKQSFRWLQNYFNFIEALKSRGIEFDQESKGFKFYIEVKELMDTIQWRYLPYQANYDLRDMINPESFISDVDILSNRWQKDVSF